MYDQLSEDYDRFVNWTNRLKGELPFIETVLKTAPAPAGPTRVLDAACGTGIHAIALAEKGWHTAGADISQGMIAQAQHNAAQAGVHIALKRAGFGGLRDAFGVGSFEALLCLGNSLPHLLTPADLSAALADFASVLSPGGVLLIQNRNFDAVLRNKERWMEPQTHREDSAEWIFLRFYDYRDDQLMDFNMVTLKRKEDGAWQQNITSTPLMPILQADLLSALAAAGFSEVTCYGNLGGDPFDPTSSGNLVITARKTTGA